MKRLLFALVFVSLLCAMTLELEEKALGTIGYTIQEGGAHNTSLIVVMLQGNTQHSSQQTDFDGVYQGTFYAIEPGTYTVRAVNPETGASAEAKITLLFQENTGELAELTQQVQEEQIEQAQTISIPEEQASWFPYLLVGVFLLIVIVILFANPLKKTKKKTKKKKSK